MRIQRDGQISSPKSVCSASQTIPSAVDVLEATAVAAAAARERRSRIHTEFCPYLLSYYYCYYSRLLAASAAAPAAAATTAMLPVMIKNVDHRI